MSYLYDWIFNEEADLSKRVLTTQAGTYTLGDLKQNVKKYCYLLEELEDLKGKRVAIIMPGAVSFLNIVLAVNKLGGTVIPINPLLKREELNQILSYINPHVIFTIKQHNSFSLGNAVQMWAESSNEEAIIIQSEDGFYWETKMIDGEEKISEKDPTPYVIGCTSGGTGMPKGIMVDWEFFKFAQRSLTAAADLSKKDKIFLMVPASGLYGLCWLLSGIYSQVPVVATESFSFPHIIKLMKWNPTSKLVASPWLFKALCMFDNINDVSVLKPLSAVYLAGEMISDEFLEGIPPLKGCKITSLYGLSELGVMMYTKTDIREGIEWTLSPEVEFKLANRSPEGVGELCFKTPCGFLGYYKHPQLMKEIYGDSWFSTGDLAKVTSEQTIQIVGRKKDMIKKAGKQVIPSEIEQLLTELEVVEKAVVLGVPHSVLGEQVVAFIVNKEEIQLREIHTYCRERLASFKVPDQFFVLKDIPLTQGKIDKVTLRKKAMSLAAVN
ncbi:hypothetical protein AC623_04455 [Bacillus sp. FJAT-27231]|uniref:class I adenylate-forming enzyme family protein n=1 Tax=Bacillus sp. FJAT-27231 TaxID=1679168 RepID=UPI000670DBA9|nr:class I adenylate-forming enzyme family protein [Bacillus sp. FJAT-27231]KMY53335.1 hypothetical protein AC623_04455 [Bacillus sp. FJAT-27231]